MPASDLYISRIGPNISCCWLGRSIAGRYKSLLDTWRECLFLIFGIGSLQCSKRLWSSSRILMLVCYTYVHFWYSLSNNIDFFSLFRPGCRTTRGRCRISRTQRLRDKRARVQRFAGQRAKVQRFAGQRTRVQWFAGQRARVQRFAGQPYRRPWRVRGDWSRGHRQWKGKVCQFRGQACRSRWRPAESDKETKRAWCVQFLPPTRPSKQFCTLLPKLFFCFSNG